MRNKRIQVFPYKYLDHMIGGGWSETSAWRHAEFLLSRSGLKVLVPFLAPYDDRVMSLLLPSSKTMLNSLPALFSKEANHA